MRRKNIFISLALLFVFANKFASAQIFTVHANYQVLSFSTNMYKNKEVSFDRIDTGYNYTFTVDLDNKTISDPIYHSDPIAITEVSHDEGNHSYKLKYKKERGSYWNYYVLQLGDHEEPVYVQKVEQLKGGSDTFFTTYTDYLWSLSFYGKCKRIKEMDLDEDKSSTSSRTKELWKIPFKEQDNYMEMRRGIVYWIRNGEQHQLAVSSVDMIKEDGSDGVNITCSEKDNEIYEITYVDSDRKIEENQVGRKRFISIMKYVGDRRVWVAVMVMI